MPAPSLDVLLSFSEQFDDALKSLLAPVLGPGCPVYAFHDEAPQTVPRCEVRFFTGEQTGPQGQSQATPVQNPPRAAAYAGEIVVEITTHRQDRQSVRPYEGMIHRAFDPETSNFNGLLTYLQVVALDHSRTSRGIDAAMKEDTLTMMFTIIFTVLPAAWPT